MYKDMMDTIGMVNAADPELGAAMERELTRQRENIELIASENIVSPAVMAAMGSVLPPMQPFAAGCWNWTPTAPPIPFCSTQPLGAKPTLPPWLPKLSGRARR